MFFTVLVTVLVTVFVNSLYNNKLKTEHENLKVEYDALIEYDASRRVKQTFQKAVKDHLNVLHLDTEMEPKHKHAYISALNELFREFVELDDDEELLE